MSAMHSISQSLLLPMIGFGLVSIAQAVTFTRMAVEPNTKFEPTQFGSVRTPPCGPRKVKSMEADRIRREDLAALIERAGLSLNAEQLEAARQSYGHLRELTDLLRIPRNRATEPAHVFRVPLSPQPDTGFVSTENQHNSEG